MQGSVRYHLRYHLLEALPAAITPYSEGYTESPMLNPSFFGRRLLKTLAPVVETRGQNDDVDNSVGFLLSGLVR